MCTLFIKLLKEQLLLPLPGAQAQYKMAPNHRLPYDFADILALNPKRGSVLILIYTENDEFLTLFIKRTEYKGVHSGQISFPGGRFEPGDLNYEKTALRESQEEIGINTSEVEIIGKLSDLYIPPSNFLVSPFIGFMSSRPLFKMDKKEVAGIIEVPINNLLKKSENKETGYIKTANNVAMKAPFYEIGGEQVWGATAMITSEFIEVVKKIL